MIIDNRKRETYIRARALLRAIAGIIVVALIQATGLFEKDVLGLDKNDWSLVVLAIYLIITAYYFYMDYYYVRMDLKPTHLIVMYYSLRPFGKRKSFSIPLTELVKVGIKKSGYGKKKLIIYRKVGAEQVATYPSISLTALSDTDLQQLRIMLARMFNINPQKKGTI
jgi:hypothetical protein